MDFRQTFINMIIPLFCFYLNQLNLRVNFAFKPCFRTWIHEVYLKSSVYWILTVKQCRCKITIYTESLFMFICYITVSNVKGIGPFLLRILITISNPILVLTIFFQPIFLKYSYPIHYLSL